MVGCHYTVTVTSWLYSDVAIPNKDVTVAFFLYCLCSSLLFSCSGLELAKPGGQIGDLESCLFSYEQFVTK